MVFNIIRTLKSLFKGKRKKTKFMTNGYTVYTVDGGCFDCASQRITAETLSTLYNLPLNRDHVHHALSRHDGQLKYNKKLIATIKYRKEVK